MANRRLTVNTAQRMREQLDYLDLQIVSADIYGNEVLERRLRRERQRIRRLLDLPTDRSQSDAER